MTAQLRLFALLMFFVFAAACSLESGSEEASDAQITEDDGVDSPTIRPGVPAPDQKECGPITLRGECFVNTVFWCENNELQRRECDIHAGSRCQDGICTNIGLGHACDNSYRTQCDDGLGCQSGACVPNPHGQLVISLIGKGRVTSSDATVDCPSDTANNCSLYVPGGTKVLLTARADPGWKFKSWSDYCVGRAETTQVSIVSRANKTCTANFEQTIANLEVIVDRGVGGTVQVSPLGINCADHCETTLAAGHTVQLTAVPDPGYQLYRWTDCKFSDGTSIDFIATGDHRCVAEFHRVDDFTVEIVGRGSVKTSHFGSDHCSDRCTTRISTEAPFKITATPDVGARFVRWEESCAYTMPSFTLTLPRFGPYLCRAIFEEAPDNPLTVSIVGNGSVTSDRVGIDCPQTSCTATYPQNQSVMLTAHPAPDSKFAGWTNLDSTSTWNCVSEFPKVLMPMREAHNCQAKFELKPTATLVWRHRDPLLNAQKAVNSLVQDPLTNTLYVASLDGFVYALDASTGINLSDFVVQSLPDSVTSLAFSTTNNTLIGASNRDVYEWSAQTGATALQPWDAGHPLAHISLSDDDLLATSLPSGMAMAGGIRLWPTRGQPDPRRLNTSQHAPHLTWQPGGTLLASSSDNATYLWKTTTNTIARSFPCSFTSVAQSASFSADGLHIATGCNDLIRVWNVATGDLLQSVPELNASHIAWRPGTEVIAVVTRYNQYFQLYDMTTGRALFEEALLQSEPLRSQLSGSITSILWSADGKLLFLGMSDGTTAAFDISQ